MVRPLRKATAARKAQQLQTLGSPSGAVGSADDSSSDNNENENNSLFFCQLLWKPRFVGVILAVILVTANVTEQALKARYGTATTMTTTSTSSPSSASVEELVNNLKRVEDELYKLKQTTIKSSDDNTETTTTTDALSLPSCHELMNRPNSPYADGEVLTRPSTPVWWKLRRDGSRELTLPQLCQLKRYTHTEAQQCLANKHMLTIGDSISRFNYLSLAYFLEHGHYPARFGRAGHTDGDDEQCHHMDSEGQPICSTKDEPSVVSIREFPTGNPHEQFHQALGDVSGQFRGHMQCHCYRNPVKPLDWTESLHHASGNNTHLTFYREYGFGNQPLNLTGRPFDKQCASQGTCTRTSDEAKNDLGSRLVNRDLFEMNGPLEALIESGVLQAKLPTPTVDYVIYNRGLWGPFMPPRAEKLLPLLHKLVSRQGGDDDDPTTSSGRCFFRSTTNQPMASKGQGQNGLHEQQQIRHRTLESGCGFLDFFHLTQEFRHLGYFDGKPIPKQANGTIWSGVAEHKDVYIDLSHFQPWVYEELNNLLLNVLCNNVQQQQ